MDKDTPMTCNRDTAQDIVRPDMATSCDGYVFPRYDYFCRSN